MKQRSVCNWLGVGVIGAGYWGQNLIRNYAQLGMLKLICDTNEVELKQLEARYPDVQFCLTLVEALGNPAVTAVVIATPAERHYDMVREALLAGKDVFVEKPLALREDDAQQLLEIAARKGRILMVGHLLQYHPVFMRLKEIVLAGELGRINYISSNRLNLGKIRREENILWSFAPHDISMILALVGEDPVSVQATGGNYLHPHIADVTTTHLEFKSGIKAHIFVSWLHPFKEQKLVVVGDRKMAVFDDTRDWSDKLLIYPLEIKCENNFQMPKKAGSERFDIPQSEPLRNECEHFINCIMESRAPLTDGREGLRVLKVLNASQRSLDGQGKKIYLTRAETKSEETKRVHFFAHKSAVIEDGVEIGEGVKIWHFSHILSGVAIGAGTRIGQNVAIGPDVHIGAGCKIQNNVSVYKGVMLEDNVFCAPSVVFTNVINPRAHISRMDTIRPTLVKEGASLGANSTIVCGVTIGRYAFVGAGAVVTRDVPDYGLVMGNPARLVNWVCACGVRLDEERVCSACGQGYLCSANGLKPKDRAAETPLAFIDLTRQQKQILPELEKNFRRVLKHGQYIMGPEVAQLEKELATFTRVKHAIGCASGTDALLMLLLALGIGPGDAVFTTPFTFIATAEVVALLGATPVFVDIDARTFNLDPTHLARAITALKMGTDTYPLPKNSPNLRPRCILPVDMFGLTADYDAIMNLAAREGLYVLEDAAQSFGATYKNRRVGGLAHAAGTSFFPAKPLGCYGDGGAIFTDDDALARELISIREHGKGSYKNDNVRLGLNGRLDTLQAAILLPKLAIFPKEIAARQRVAASYSQRLQDVVSTPYVPGGYESVWAQYSICVNDREALQKTLKIKGVPAVVYYPTPLHLQTVFASLGYKKGDFPISEAVSRDIISIPMHPYVEEREIDIVTTAIRNFYNLNP